MSQRKLTLLDGLEGRDVMQDILDNMRRLVVTYECFRRDNLNGPDLLQIIATRRSIQHNLLCPPFSNDCRYLVCRYTILIFLVETIYPKPRHVGIHRRLAEKLMLALDESSILGYWEQQPEAFTWASVLGGAAASDTPLYSWYVAQVSSTGCEFTTGDWNSAYQSLSSFLLPSAEHERRCYRFWHDAREFRAMRDSAST